MSELSALRPPGAAQPSGSRRPRCPSDAGLQLPADFVSLHLPLSAWPAGRGQVAGGRGPMGAGSRGEGGGEEEGGGLWAPAPFIAAAGRARVPCFRSHGGANSCYQQAPGCLQHGGRRHHPVASDRCGGNAGKRRGRRPPRPESGAWVWWGSAAAPAPSWPLRPVGRGRCWGCRGSPGSAAPSRLGLRSFGPGNPGPVGRRGAEPAQRARRVPGAG